MLKYLKKYIIFLGLAFFASLSLVLAFTTEAKDNYSVKASADTETIYSQSTVNFINSVGETARQIGQEYDIYASVLIAQAILESNSGQSSLSQAPYYNYFGVKGDYNGNSVTMKTWEDDGSGNAYQIDDDFRSYGSLSESFNDYAALLSTSYYSGTWKSNTSSYMEATAALTGTYATDTSYKDKLNSIIAYYDLTVYDQPLISNAEAATDSNGSVWNSYRGSYTDSETLAEDEAWAERD
ncbi:glucosaminidase domain-containing protein [Streptococcus dentiloxodontae]